MELTKQFLNSLQLQPSAKEAFLKLIGLEIKLHILNLRVSVVEIYYIFIASPIVN